MSKFYSALKFGSTCFEPHRPIIRSVLYKLYSQTLVCGTTARTTRHVQPCPVVRVFFVISCCNHNWFYGSQPLKLTPWSTVLIEELIVSDLVKKFLYFMEPGCSLQSQQQPAACPCPEPKLIQCTPSQHISLRSILILSSHIHQGLCQHRTVEHPQAMFVSLSWTSRCLAYNNNKIVIVITHNFIYYIYAVTRFDHNMFIFMFKYTESKITCTNIILWC